MDGAMEEVIRKLEEGANPEELEAKMEGVMDDPDVTDEGNDAIQERMEGTEKLKFLLTRDPELYEMEDFFNLMILPMRKLVFFCF